jgi:hypothetical protein
MKRLLAAITLGCVLALGGGRIIKKKTIPNGPGNPGEPKTKCSTLNVTSGNSVAARGSVFNPGGIAGTVYAGNPNTASLAHANSIHAVSRYDVACFQQTSVH